MVERSFYFGIEEDCSGYLGIKLCPPVYRLNYFLIQFITGARHYSMMALRARPHPIPNLVYSTISLS